MVPDNAFKRKSFGEGTQIQIQPEIGIHIRGCLLIYSFIIDRTIYRIGEILGGYDFTVDQRPFYRIGGRINFIDNISSPGFIVTVYPHICIEECRHKAEQVDIDIRYQCKTVLEVGGIILFFPVYFIHSFRTGITAVDIITYSLISSVEFYIVPLRGTHVFQKNFAPVVVDTGTIGKSSDVVRAVNGLQPVIGQCLIT